jgi:glycosyltransferase involved in cell wall biosynthesis
VNILLGVHQFFPHHYTGTERYVLNLAKQLQKMGHGTKVLTYSVLDHDDFRQGHTPNILRKEYIHEGIPVVSLMHKEKRDDYAFCFDLIDEDFYNESMAILKENNFDIYHCAHPFRISASVKAARDSGVKVVFMVTDYWLMCPLGIMRRSDNTLCEGPDNGRNCMGHCFAHLMDGEIKNRISASHKLIDSCDCLLSPSHFLIWLFDKAGYIPSDRFLLSRHGFDYTRKKGSSHREPKDKITFGYIGTIQHHKGVHIMVEGFKKSPHQNIRLQVWGGCFNEVEYERNLMEKAKEDRRIEFKGYYEFNDVERILQDIDVVIVPSIWYENAPLTISTSLAYGIPVITSNVGGMSEMVKDGQNGLTFRIGDPEDLSAKIGLIADKPDLVSTFSRNIRYPIRVEEEAFNTELVYKQIMT